MQQVEKANGAQTFALQRSLAGAGKKVPKVAVEVAVRQMKENHSSRRPDGFFGILVHTFICRSADPHHTPRGRV